MKLLPDTQVLLCAITDCPRIEGVRIEGVRKRLLAQDNEVFFSVASLWKIVIKVSLGKLQADAGQVRVAAMARVPVLDPAAGMPPATLQGARQP